MSIFHVVCYMPFAPFLHHGRHFSMPHCFWIECNYYGAGHLCEKLNIPHLLTLDDPRDHTEFCFAVTADAKHGQQLFYAFLRSAMNNEKLNYVAVDRQIDNLSELPSIFKNLLDEGKLTI